VSAASGAPPVTVTQHVDIPAAWDALLAGAAEVQLAQERVWLDLAARHLPGARPRVLLAHHEGEVVGGLAAIERRRRGLVRLESSLDGVPAGPVLRADLPHDLRTATFAALLRALAGLVGGRVLLAAQTLAGTVAIAQADRLAAPPWRLAAYAASVLDCREGLDHVERALWTNNRRNERNRGLKRGCVLAAETDPAAIDEWYPLYRSDARNWAQAPLPAAYLRAALGEAPDRFVLTTCRHQGRLIGGHVCFRSAGRLVAWQSGMAPEFHRTLFPTTLVYWQDAVLACAEGLAAVDYGGSLGRDSLAAFKRRCGTVPEARRELLAWSRPGRLARGAAGLLRRFRGRPS